MAIDSNLLSYVGKYEREMLDDPDVEELIFNVVGGLRQVVEIPEFGEWNSSPMLAYRCLSGMLGEQDWASFRADTLIGYAYLEGAMATRSGGKLEEVREEHVRKAGVALKHASELLQCAENKQPRMAQISLQDTVLRNTIDQRRCRELHDLTELAERAGFKG